MIRLSRLNGSELVVNCELIKFIEETPDTILTLSTGEKFMVRESLEEVIERTKQYRKEIFGMKPEEAD